MSIQTVLEDLEKGAKADGTADVAKYAIDAMERQNASWLDRITSFVGMSKGKPMVGISDIAQGGVSAASPEDSEGGEGEESPSFRGMGKGMKGFMCKGCAHTMAMAKGHPAFNAKKQVAEVCAKRHNCNKCGNECEPVMGDSDDSEIEESSKGSAFVNSAEIDEAVSGVASVINDIPQQVEATKEAMGAIAGRLEQLDSFAPALQLLLKGVSDTVEATESRKSFEETLVDSFTRLANEIKQVLPAISAIGDRVETLEKGINAMAPSLAPTGRRVESPLDRSADRRANEALKTMSKGTNEEEKLTDSDLDSLKFKGVMSLSDVSQYKMFDRLPYGKTVASLKSMV